MFEIEPEVLAALDLHASLQLGGEVPRGLRLIHDHRRDLAELGERIRRAMQPAPWPPARRPQSPRR